MGATKIEWTSKKRADGTFMPGYTVNPWHGCEAVAAGCLRCYAEVLSKRWGNNVWGNDNPRKEIKSAFNDLAKYQKLAAQAGEVHSVFVGSMMDIFEKPMPMIDSKGERYKNIDTGVLRATLFSNIDLGLYPNMLFLFLTKRPSNINKYIPDHWKETPPENIIFGSSPSDQKTFNDTVRQLLKVKGKRFLSIEPQLDFITVKALGFGGGGIDWIVQGGESGPKKRPFNIEWARSMRDECKELNIPFFFKQIDKIQAIPDDLQIRQFPV